MQNSFKRQMLAKVYAVNTLPWYLLFPVFPEFPFSDLQYLAIFCMRCSISNKLTPSVIPRYPPSSATAINIQKVKVRILKRSNTQWHYWFHLYFSCNFDMSGKIHFYTARIVSFSVFQGSVDIHGFARIHTFFVGGISVLIIVGCNYWAETKVSSIVLRVIIYLISSVQIPTFPLL